MKLKLKKSLSKREISQILTKNELKIQEKERTTTPSRPFNSYRFQFKIRKLQPFMKFRKNVLFANRMHKKIKFLKY